MKDFRNLNPLDYLKILWSRRWYALAGFMLVSCGAGIYSWRMPNIYRSQSMILVESAAIPQDYVRPSERSSPEEQIAAISSQLRSRSFLERMIQEFRLFGYGSSQSFSMDAAIASVGNNVKVVNTSRNTFSISYSATDPQLAQTVTRRVVEALIQSSNSSRKSRAVEADQFLDEQLRQTEQNLSAQEEKIKQFKIAHLGSLPEQSAANMNALSGLNAQLAAAENTVQHARDALKLLDFRAQEQKRLGALTSSILSSPSLSLSKESTATITDPLPNSLLKTKEAELATLSSKYTPNHPDVVRLSREVEDLKRQLAAEISTANEIPEPTALGEADNKPAAGVLENSATGANAMSEVESAEIRMQTEAAKNEISKREKDKEVILGQIRLYQSRLNLAPALEQEFMALSRERDALGQQYANLKSKKFQTQMTANLETDRNSDTYKVIDEANLPEKPAFPDRMHIIMMGLGAALLVGIGAAFGREFLNTTLGSEDEAAALLKIPVLATISEIPRRQPKRLIKLGGIAKSA